MSQWVYLGYYIIVCMALPDICGPAGGAISFWINVIDSPDFQGIVSSQPRDRVGLAIYCDGNILR